MQLFKMKIEFSPNLEYLITLPGFGKLLTVVFGIIAVGLGGYSYDDDDDLELWKEELYLYFVTLALVVSAVYLTLFCFSYQLVCSKRVKILDTVSHAIAGVLSITVACLLLYSAAQKEGTGTGCKFASASECPYFDEKIGAGVFSIVNGVVYMGTAVAIYMAKDL